LKKPMRKLRKFSFLSVYRYRLPMQVRKCVVLACGDSYPLCPRCGSLTDREYMAFCDQCGQCLGWKFYAFAQTVRYGAGDQKTAKFPVLR